MPFGADPPSKTERMHDAIRDKFVDAWSQTQQNHFLWLLSVSVLASVRGRSLAFSFRHPDRYIG